jgi:hypothetical protein
MTAASVQKPGWVDCDQTTGEVEHRLHVYLDTNGDRQYCAGYTAPAPAVRPALELVVGQNYRIVSNHENSHNEKDRETVLAYLGEDDRYYFMDGRPEAGTQNLNKRYVKSIEPTDQPVQPFPKIIR